MVLLRSKNHIFKLYVTFLLEILVIGNYFNTINTRE